MGCRHQEIRDVGSFREDWQDVCAELAESLDDPIGMIVRSSRRQEDCFRQVVVTLHQARVNYVHRQEHAAQGMTNICNFDAVSDIFPYLFFCHLRA